MLNNPRKSREDILDLAVPLFAKSGFDGVSIRNVASQIELTPAALYYHFKDKEALYFETVKHAFETKTSAAKDLIDNGDEVFANLEKFINWFVTTLNRDNDFQKLLQWVLLDSNPKRMQSLVKDVFSDLFLTTRKLAESFSPRYDPQMLSISIIGLVLCHFQSEEGRKFLPGRKAIHDKPQVISAHIIKLLKNGLAPAC
ncbi:MAG: TetR/AcrR family transcriptional regulator [Gammaproteobacteria bacterium]|nr:TetR/AcrR family transcriptional regulator [Gammaproteobacteria bacterium]MBQ0840554.1 TetR/AcrR family transcriptional regulator [Gammaproteobacteria bacterium]